MNVNCKPVTGIRAFLVVRLTSSPEYDIPWPAGISCQSKDGMKSPDDGDDGNDDGNDDDDDGDDGDDGDGDGGDGDDGRI